MRSRAKILLSLVGLSLIIALLLAATHVQALSDWYRLRGYSPPANITTIAIEDKLSAHANHILLATRPAIESNPGFLNDCPQSEQTIVLGCYHAGAGIFSDVSTLYVKNVEDSRLHGVEEVTLAHEMLHAAYDRMGSKEKNQVNAMLLDYYKNGLTDQRIIQTMNSYKISEPNDLVNEMHSVFGTEISNLPAPLENYYKKYFTDRSAVTKFATGYEDEFTNRTNQIKADDTQLTQIKQQIEAAEVQLHAQLDSISAARAAVERSNDPAQISQYNASVAAYNNGVRAVQAQIATYNRLVEQRNAIAEELRSLQSSLSSGLSAQPAQ